MSNKMRPIHPGEILRDELNELGLSANALAMPIPLARVHCRDPIFSPFSGLPADGKGGPNKKDPTLLFVYHGDAGFYAYVSERLGYALSEDIQYLEPENLHASVDIDGGLILEVETDSAVNYYGFAPAG